MSYEKLFLIKYEYLRQMNLDMHNNVYIDSIN